MRINIFPHLSAAFSMQRYLKGLVAGLYALHQHEVVIHTPGRSPEEAGWWHKYVAYWFKARANRKGVNIILSERFSFLLQALQAKSSVIICHDMVTLLNPSISAVRKLRYKIILRIMARARFIVCISESTKCDLIRLNPFIPPHKVKVIHNGIENFWFEDAGHNISPAIQSQAGISRYFLVVGTDAWNKNFKLVIDAMAEVQQKDFVVIKVGPLSLAHKQGIERHGLGDRLIMIDKVSDSDLRWLYQHAIALLFPSLHEGFGWPPLEAMASGCPVIASSASSITEVCGSAAHFIDPQNSATLKSAMETLMTDENEREKLIQSGKEQAKKFSWEKTAKEFVILLENLA